MLRAQMPDPSPLQLVGPPGLARFVKNVRADLRMHIRYPIEVTEWHKGAGEVAYQDDRVRILWRPVQHSVFCLGYRLEEHQRPGRFDPDAARRLGVPAGPLFGRLQAGESVELENDVTIAPDQVLGPQRRGRHVAFVTDTVATPTIKPLLKEVDIAFVESMFLPEHEAEAEQKRHMTAEQAARLANEAGARRLVLVHISPRYENRELKRFNAVAKAAHPNAEVGRERQVIAVPLPD